MGTPSFHLYIDDSGTRLPDKSQPITRNDGLDHFALGGVLIASEDIHSTTRQHEEFCERFNIDYPLHSHSIRTQKNAFRWLKHDSKRANSFHSALESYLCNLPIKCHACVVHRPGYNARYEHLYGQARWELSKSAYTIVVERALKYARHHGRKLIVYVEQTGKREDRAIRDYHAHMREHGMYFDANRSQAYSPLAEDDFTKYLLKTPQFTTKYHPIMQIADLVLFPLVKGGYDKTYRPYAALHSANRLIDQHLPQELADEACVKYYCFDF
ncbi:DUF3800 domain-containing protein [Magnetovibrio sp. PR-2]|uniref:DUF3800 domain-containing protein n=1 Tax=Magnetovibrio sp. PR-2 TaxID=3120356 RepID=UPI002FCE0902